MRSPTRPDHKKKAAALLDQDGGSAPKKGTRFMSKITPAEARKYSDYSVRVAADGPYPSDVEQLDDGTWAKFYYRIYRSPSHKEFTLRVCPDATAEERAHAIRVLNTMPAGGWAEFRPQCWLKRRREGGYYTWHVYGGDLIDNPLIQLELEMMIDLSEGATL